MPYHGLNVYFKLEKFARLIETNMPPEIIHNTFTKCFQPKLDKNKDLEKIIFTRTFNPNHVINLNKLTRSLENIRSNELKQCFQNKTVQLATRQPKNVPKIQTKAKFEENPLPCPAKEVAFFHVMIVFITDVDISSRTNLFNPK